jgi:hypothetical protein
LEIFKLLIFVIILYNRKYLTSSQRLSIDKAVSLFTGCMELKDILLDNIQKGSFLDYC